MTYRLDAPELASTGLTRIVLEEIDAAAAECAESAIAASADPHLELRRLVHESRKRCKRVRGALRLYRDALPAYAAENARFRDAARKLGDLRDAQVAVETFQLLLGEPPAPEREGWRPFADALTERRDRAYAEQAGGRLFDFAGELAAARPGVAAWTLAPEVLDAVGGGFERGYRAARRAWRKVREDPTTERLHEWRKQVKYHWYHVQLLQGAWSGLVLREQRLDRLGTLLGADHDLAVLDRLLPRDQAAEERAGEVEAAIAEHRASLQAEASVLGRDLFRKKPRTFGRKMRRRLLAWSDGALAETGAG